MSGRRSRRGSPFDSHFIKALTAIAGVTASAVVIKDPELRTVMISLFKEIPFETTDNAPRDNAQ